MSGLAVGAATLSVVPVQTPLTQLTWVVAVGGFAMLPDLDQRCSTVSDMWGPVTDVPSGVLGKIAGGHRWGTHDAVLAPLAFGGLALLAADAYWSSLLLMALAIGLALRALHFVIPGTTETTIVGNLALSWFGAWYLLDHMVNPVWLPYAVAAGVLTHIVGDAITTAGVPVPILWILNRGRMVFLPMRTGATIEKVVLVPLFLAATIGFVYVNTEVRETVDPLVQRLLVSLG
jgi:membrane-bound metal-dependent hydrolase YbcI (DUF457 family)